MTSTNLTRRSALAGAGVLGAAALGAFGLESMAKAAELPTDFGPLHHVGVVLAPTFDDAKAKLGATLGIEWYDERTETLTLRDHLDRVHTYTDRYVLSRGGAPHLELLDPVPGSFFRANRNHPVVEIGYVVGDDLAAASQQLTDAGMPRLGTIATEPQQGAVGVAWHQVAKNFLIELLATDPTLDM